MSKKIDGPFAPRPIAMLQSPAMRALSLTGRRILDRLEIELANHGGKDNGKLPVTHADFRRFGIDHDAVGPGLREVEALGFIEITVRGIAGNAAHRSPNRFRLTYRPAGGESETNDWRQITTIEEATEIAAKARTSKPKNYSTVRGKRKSSARSTQSGKTQKPVRVSRTTKSGFQSGFPGLKARNPQSGNPGLLSRYLAMSKRDEEVGPPPERRRRSRSRPAAIPTFHKRRSKRT